MSDYQYKASGLDNVFIRGLDPVIDDDGHKVYRIPNVNRLHLAIAKAIVSLPVAMSGKALRFLRTEIGLTQAELARVVHREPLAISRWERSEIEIDSNAEVVIRMLACEMLQLSTCDGVRQVAEFVVHSTMSVPIVIDGSDPTDYRQLAA